MSQPSANSNSYRMALVTLTSLFFMWGFITCLNDLLIPYFKKVFFLSHFQSNLVQLAFFLAYFVVSTLYFAVSSIKGDPIHKIGYKNTLVAGLVIASLACLMFFAEAGSQDPSFAVFLGSLFLLGTGFSFLQIAANPLVACLGSEETSASRLNLSNAFNALGTTFSPAIGAVLIYNFFAGTTGTEAVQVPYLILACVLLVLAGILFFSEVPNSIGGSAAGTVVRGAGALRHPYVILGMLGIFCYVGAEVTIGSNLSSFMEESLGIPNNIAAYYLMFYWGGSMSGRFMGSIALSKMPIARKYCLMALAGVLSVALVCFVAHNSQAAISPSQATVYLGMFVVNYLTLIAANSVPHRTLGLFAVANMALIVAMLCCTGAHILWILLSVGLFNSIMFSTIFTLSIEGLKEYTSQASSLLVMMILGGAIVPPLQGLVADVAGVHVSFAIPLVCYAYLAWFGFAGSNIGKAHRNAGIKVNHPESLVLRDA